VDGIGPKGAARLMKIYGDLAQIGVAEIADLVERGKLKETTAKAVRAAALLALEDQQTAKKRLAKTLEPSSQGSNRALPRAGSIYEDIDLSIGESLAAEAAAEPDGDYQTGPDAL
jgi:excinuclease ABC subunit C